MITLMLRALVVVYLVLPIAAVIVGLSAVRAVTDSLTPVYETAADRIADAREGLEDELADLKANFQPMIDAFSRIRTGLSTIRSFINGTVNGVIDAVNGFGFDFDHFDSFTLPVSFNVNFLDDVADHVRDLTDGVDDVVTGTADFVRDQSATLTLLGVLIAGWLALGYVLGAVVIVRGLWR